MKSGEDGTPNMDEWVIQQLQAGDVVSSDPKISPSEAWLTWNVSFTENNITLKIVDNLVDRIWGIDENRPPYPDTAITVLDLQFAGMDAGLTHYKQRKTYNWKCDFRAKLAR